MLRALLVLIIGLFIGNNKSYEFVDIQINENVSNFKNMYIKYNYFNDEHIDDISNKLNKYLNSTLKDKGYYITRHSIDSNVDPYLVTAVMLQETGCYWTCSKLVRNCNNVAGNKGKPSCGGGSYRKFDTIEEGIQFAINKLAWYYNNGLTTPEKIGPKYAEDPGWARKVNNYINKLKNA